MSTVYRWLARACLLALLQPAIAAFGDLDPDFNPRINGWINALMLQDDGKILITGGFAEVNGVARSHMARLHPDGTLDTSFSPEIDIGRDPATVSVYSMAIQSDGKVVIAGAFKKIGQIDRQHVARLNIDGTLDPDLTVFIEPNSLHPAYISNVILQPDGRIVVSGEFAQLNGVLRNSVARLNPNGTVDTEFYPFADTEREGDLVWVFESALQPDGKILVFGRMLHTTGTYTPYLVRLNADGTLDTQFKTETNDEVEVLALQGNGRILISGDFTTVWGSSRLGLARLNANGTLDAGFKPQGDFGSTEALVAQEDGTVLLGGGYLMRHKIGGELFEGALVRLDFDDIVDRDFLQRVKIEKVGSPGAVTRMLNQADRKLLIAGDFTSVNGVARTNFARLFAKSDDKVSICCARVLAGQFGFDISSSAPSTVVVENSTNLLDWIPSRSVTLGNVAVPFTDPIPTNLLRRFYRIVAPR
jgi:uncharacterized delta-60 repeat protein